MAAAKEPAWWGEAKLANMSDQTYIITTTIDPARHQGNPEEPKPCVSQTPSWEIRFNTAFDELCTAFWARIEARQLQQTLSLPAPGGTSSVDQTHQCQHKLRDWMDVQPIKHPQPCEPVGDRGSQRVTGTVYADEEPRDKEALECLSDLASGEEEQQHRYDGLHALGDSRPRPEDEGGLDRNRLPTRKPRFRLPHTCGIG
ncbi:Hypothetical predicted protein [Pelobates cultripes]|uniref:Uncharacterized protein n=1 Tax=Pelobates cultripes TaxID=61616 RepID=A0AAD1SFE9_PELCU|nr:Hypothetical predicted protein [Pelobates cultripes]